MYLEQFQKTYVPPFSDRSGLGNSQCPSCRCFYKLPFFFYPHIRGQNFIQKLLTLALSIFQNKLKFVRCQFLTNEVLGCRDAKISISLYHHTASFFYNKKQPAGFIPRAVKYFQVAYSLFLFADASAFHFLHVKDGKKGLGVNGLDDLF